jgi:peptidoglycan/LPS O-acetylase OafA/YrhL
VAVFFVLSGYLITHIVWHSPDTTWAGYRSFLRRRFTRLAPAMIGFIAIWGIVSAVIGVESIRSVVESAALAGTQTTAYYLAFGGTEHGWGPTWSLSVEWCFYLLWPLVILFMRRRGAGVLTVSRLAAGLGVILYLVALPLSVKQFYYLPLANISVLLWGGALALRHIWRSRAVDLDPTSAGRDPAMVLLGILLLVALTAAPGDQGNGYRWLFLPATVVGALIV